MKTFLIIAAIQKYPPAQPSGSRIGAFRRRAWLIVEWSDFYPRQVGMHFTPVTRCHLHLDCWRCHVVD